MASNNKIRERQGKKISDNKKLHSYNQYEALNSCGCCKEILYFKTDESALTTMNNTGLRSVATIVDDAGISHTQIDTFYGLVKITKKEAKRRAEEYNESIRKSKRPWG